MKRLFPILLATILLGPAAAHADFPTDYLYEICKNDGEVSVDTPAGEEWGIHPYKRNYILLGQWGTPSAEDGKMVYTKYQLSIKQNLCRHLYLGFTQKSLWSITAPSIPFRGMNYNPEFYLDFTNYGVGVWRLGKIGLFEHESNGRDGLASRSWNRFYWEPQILTSDSDILPFNFQKLVVALKWWHAYNIDDNPDIRDYQGNQEFSVTLNQPRVQWAIIVRKGQKDYGSLQMDINYRFKGNMDLFFQLWDGYGESLIDYNRSSTRYGFGIAISR